MSKTKDRIIWGLSGAIAAGIMLWIAGVKLNPAKDLSIRAQERQAAYKRAILRFHNCPYDYVQEQREKERAKHEKTK